MKVTWAIPILVSILIFGSTLSIAIGHGLVDQDHSGPFTLSAHLLIAQPLGQEFVPNESNLVAVDIFLVGRSLTAGQTDTVTITIWEGFIGNNEPLATGSELVTSAGSTLIVQEVHFDLNPSAILNPGTTYVIQVEGEGNVFALPRTINNYLPGKAIINGVLQPLIDFGFRTYFLEEDTIPPEITCPPDITINASDPTDPGFTGVPTATDNVDPNPAITFTNVVSGSNPTIITRTWTATDASGNSSECVQIITVTTPEIEIGGTLIPIDTTTLLLAGVQSTSMWLIPVVAAGIAIGIFVIIRRK